MALVAAFGSSCAPPPQLQAALRAHPTAENYAAIGEYFGDKDQHQCAAEAWAAALKLDPRSAKVSYMLGLNLYAAGQPEQAAAALQKSAELNLGSLQTRLLLATVFDQLHRSDEAATEWRAALDIDPNSSLALDGVARSLLAKNDNPAVIQMLGSRPLDEDLALDLAIAYDRSGSIDQAAATLAKAHQADPSSTKLANALALVYLKQERRQDAAALMEKQYALHPDDLATQVDYFRVLVIDEEREKAAPLGKRLLVRLPHDFDVLYLNGELEREGGDYAGAKDHLEEAVHLNPNHANCRYNLGVALARLSEPAKAKEQLEKAIALGWTGPEIRYELANIYRALGDAEMAQEQMKLYQQETRAKEERTVAISKAAQADQDMRSGNLTAAESQYRLAVEANPKLTPAWIGLAATLAKQSRFSEAKEVSAMRCDWSRKTSAPSRLRETLAATLIMPSDRAILPPRIAHERKNADQIGHLQFHFPTDKLNPMELPNWTRRKLLASTSAIAVCAAVPEGLSALLPAQAAAKAPFSRFTDVAAAAGLTHPTIFGDTDHATYLLENVGGGCAFFDYDNDGWIDVFVMSGRRLSGVPPGSTNRLYKNNRDGTFTDVTEKAGLISAAWAIGVCVGDYNNDGFEDLFLTYYGQNRLYRNNGNGTFTDVTEKAGLLQTGTHSGSGCAFVDYNRDGLLDLFVSNYLEGDLASTPKPSLTVPDCSYEGVPVACGPRGLLTPRHFLYRNNGDGTFTDVSKESGVAAIAGSFGLTAVAFDADEDGWPDIFVACDSTPSLLLMNNHDGTFREEALFRGVAVSGDGQEMSGMGVGLGDYDLDGHTDILKTHFQHQASGLYHNNGKAEFTDVTVKAGLGLEQRFISWGCGIADLDNDGYPDILVVCGTVYPELEKTYPKYPARDPRLVFRNRGDGTFIELGDEAGPGISARHMSRGCAFGDFDNDGDLDVLILNQNEPPSLLRNDAPPGNRWIKIRLEGVKSNRSAIGARVVVHYGGKIQVQELASQASYLSSNDPRLHFGLGAATTADIEVRWPLGLTENLRAVAANQLITLREGQGIVKGRPLR